MIKRPLIVSTMALSAALMWGATTFQAAAQEKSIEALAPQGGWSVARMDQSGVADSYCALSRQYAEGLVLTLGRNMAEEYSVAIDFQSATLNTNKAYSVTLQPGPGQIRAYEMLPASQRAMVIRLGFDENFLDAMQDSGYLKAEIDGKTYQFQVPNFSAGKADLNNCLSGLKGKSATKVADKKFSAEKVADAKPMAPKIEPAKTEAPKKIEMAKVETSKAESKPEMTPQPAPAVEEAKPAAKSTAQKDAPQKSVMIERTESAQKPLAKTQVKAPDQPAPKKAIEISRVDTKQVSAPPRNTVSKKMDTEVPTTVVRSNNDALLPKSMLSKQPVKKEVTEPAPVKQVPVKQAIAQTAAQKKQREALEQLKADNERLNKALQSQMAKPAKNAPDESAEVESLQKQINKLQSDLIKAKIEPNKIDDQLKTDIEKLKAENQQLKMAMQAKAKAAVQAEAKKTSTDMTPVPPPPEERADAKSPEVMHQLDNLKAENARLSSALQGQEKKLSSFDAKSPEASKELADIREELRLLREENRKLASDARKARGQIDTAVFDTGNQALTKIREYEKKLQAAQNDNVELSKEIEEMRRMQEDGRLASVSGDWDLEKSTKRYNEAEREIKRLGMLLEQQRMAHRQEKAELEQMLFDPAVTDKEQRRHLRELELQLMSAERQLQATGRPMPARPTMSSTTPRSSAEERVALNGLTPDPMVAQQRESLEMQRLNNKIERQNRQLQAYNRQQAEMMAASPAPKVQSQPVSPVQTMPPPKLDITVHKPAPRAPVSAPVVPVTQQPTPPPAPQPRAMASASAFGQGQIQQLLNSAGVSVSGAVTKQAAGQYRWSAGNLVGQAQIVPAQQAGSVDQFAQSFIAKAKRSCGGDFASLPSTAGSGQSRAFEIACISPTRSTSSSVIFTRKGKDLVAISHESAAENMDMAMDARDRIAASL